MISWSSRLKTKSQSLNSTWRFYSYSLRRMQWSQFKSLRIAKCKAVLILSDSQMLPTCPWLRTHHRKEKKNRSSTCTILKEVAVKAVSEVCKVATTLIVLKVSTVRRASESISFWWVIQPEGRGSIRSHRWAKFKYKSVIGETQLWASVQAHTPWSIIISPTTLLCRVRTLRSHSLIWCSRHRNCLITTIDSERVRMEISPNNQSRQTSLQGANL